MSPVLIGSLLCEVYNYLHHKIAHDCTNQIVASYARGQTQKVPQKVLKLVPTKY